MLQLTSSRINKLSSKCFCTTETLSVFFLLVTVSWSVLDHVPILQSVYALRVSSLQTQWQRNNIYIYIDMCRAFFLKTVSVRTAHKFLPAITSQSVHYNGKSLSGNWSLLWYFGACYKKALYIYLVTRRPHTSLIFKLVQNCMCTCSCGPGVKLKMLVWTLYGASAVIWETKEKFLTGNSPADKSKFSTSWHFNR